MKHIFVIVLVAILVLIYIWHKIYFNEPFENTDDSLKLYVFVSNHCSHCLNYLKNNHDDVCALMKSKGLKVYKIQSDGSVESSDLFNKYNVQFVPTGLLVKGDKVVKNLGSDLTPQSVKYALEN